jgi:hypothetical protein
MEINKAACPNASGAKSRVSRGLAAIAINWAVPVPETILKTSPLKLVFRFSSDEFLSVGWDGGLEEVRLRGIWMKQ